MPYIDESYYIDEYGGKPLTNPSDLSRLIRKASDKIEFLIKHRIKQSNISEVNIHIRERVMKATAQMVEFYDDNDFYKTKDESSSGSSLKSVNIGSFSYTEDEPKASEKSTATISDIPDEVYETLMVTGLLYAGLDAIGGLYR